MNTLKIYRLLKVDYQLVTKVIFPASGHLRTLVLPSASGWLRRFAVPAVGAVRSHFLDTPRPPIYGPRRRTPTAADFPQFWMV